MLPFPGQNRFPAHPPISTVAPRVITDQVTTWPPPMPRPNPMRDPMLPQGGQPTPLVPVPQPGAVGPQGGMAAPRSQAALAEALLMQANRGGPIETPMEGIGRLAQQFAGARMARKAEESAREEAARQAALARQQELEDARRERQWGREDYQWKKEQDAKGVKPELVTIKQGGKDISVWKNPDGTITPVSVDGVDSTAPQYSQDYKDYNPYIDDLNAEPSVKKYKNSIDTFSSMTKSFESDSTASDLDFVYGFAKIMDPDSVVREGEYATVAQSPAIGERVRGTLMYVLEGKGKLTPEVRRQLLDIAKNRIDSYRTSADQSVSRYREGAPQYGLNPDLVAPEGYLGDVPEIPVEKKAIADELERRGLVEKGFWQKLWGN